MDSAKLVDELKLTNQKASIHDICIRDHDPASCNLREVLRSFIHAQPPQSCKKIVEKVVTALGNLGDNYVKECVELRKMFSIGDLCVYSIFKCMTQIIVPLTLHLCFNI